MMEIETKELIKLSEELHEKTKGTAVEPLIQKLLNALFFYKGYHTALEGYIQSQNGGRK